PSDVISAQPNRGNFLAGASQRFVGNSAAFLRRPQFRPRRAHRRNSRCNLQKSPPRDPPILLKIIRGHSPTPLVSIPGPGNLSSRLLAFAAVNPYRLYVAPYALYFFSPFLLCVSARDCSSLCLSTLRLLACLHVRVELRR